MNMEPFAHAYSKSPSTSPVVCMAFFEKYWFCSKNVFSRSTNSEQTVYLFWDLSNFDFWILWDIWKKHRVWVLAPKAALNFQEKPQHNGKEAAKRRLWRPTFWIEFMFHHLFSEWPWARCFISVCLSFFIVGHESSIYFFVLFWRSKLLLQKASKYLACNK